MNDLKSYPRRGLQSMPAKALRHCVLIHVYRVVHANFPKFFYKIFPTGIYPRCGQDFLAPGVACSGGVTQQRLIRQLALLIMVYTLRKEIYAERVPGATVRVAHVSLFSLRIIIKYVNNVNKVTRGMLAGIPVGNSYIEIR